MQTVRGTIGIGQYNLPYLYVDGKLYRIAWIEAIQMGCDDAWQGLNAEGEVAEGSSSPPGYDGWIEQGTLTLT